MSKKGNLAKQINILQAEMNGLESKRSRSMASILEALVSGAKPNDDDLKFFRTFTAEIEMMRKDIQNLTRELEELLR